jgi:MOSC domain-containing protein YiiM
MSFGGYPLTIEIRTFSTGLPKTMTYLEDKEVETGICKQPVEEAFLSKAGFSGDGVADLLHHGGPDRAVCVYPFEHYARWNDELKTTLPPSTFGENLTVTNMLEESVHIGDIYRLGDATIQITQGRVPCSTITQRTGLPTLLKRLVQTGFTGYLCRVLEEGTVRHDSSLTLLELHPAKVSVLFSNQVRLHNSQSIDDIRKVLAVEELADEWRMNLNEKLEKLLTVTKG